MKARSRKLQWLISKRSSSIIEAIDRLCKSTSLSTYAYFFFDNRGADNGLVLLENMFRSLISQLCYRCEGIPVVVDDAYRAHGAGREQPSFASLQQILQILIEGLDDAYIMIDSLDECGDRIELLQWIRIISGWNSAKLHLLLTSRIEHDITRFLERLPSVIPIRLDGPHLAGDIGVYLDERLSLNNRWSAEIRALIRATLMKGADGMCVFCSPFG